MRRCCSARRGWSPPKSLSPVPRRWTSHDKASLSKEALLSKVEEGFGDAPDRPRVDPDRKRVRTAAGELPISPLFDPEWIAKRRRPTKVQNAAPSGRFRSKVYNNTYARALESPIRVCPMSRAALPRFFLQDFEAVKHPKTGEPWWAPGPLSFHHLENDLALAARKEAKALEESLEHELPGKHESNRTNMLPSEDEAHLAAKTDPSVVEEFGSAMAEDTPVNSPLVQRKRHRGMGERASVVVYVANKKSLFERMSLGKVNLLGMRRGMSVDNTLRTSVWRPDMANFLEGMLRKQAVNTLIRRANRAEGQDPHKFIQPCASWDQIKDVRLRGCVLWLPKVQVSTVGYPTFDVEAQFGAKMAVYNLPWLLGEEELARLKEEAPLFRETELLVLKQWPSWSMKGLHMLLWRLQGFLADSNVKT